MSSPLQSSPIGLLEAYDLKTLGSNPNAFAANVQPTVETLDFYTVNKSLVQTLNAASGALNSVPVTLTVPTNATWLVRAVSIVMIRAGADIGLTLEAFASLNRPSSVTGCAIFTPRFEPTVATDLSQTRALYLPRPLLLAPGTRINLVQASTMTAGGSLRLSLDTSVLPG